MEENHSRNLTFMQTGSGLKRNTVTADFQLLTSRTIKSQNSFPSVAAAATSTSTWIKMFTYMSKLVEAICCAQNEFSCKLVAKNMSLHFLSIE